MSCPSITQLTTTDITADAELRRHIDGCVRCRAILAARAAEAFEAPDDEALELPALNWEPRADPNAPPAVGAVHAVRTPDETLLLLALVVDLDDEEVTVFPLSTDVHMAGDWDVILDPAVMGYAAMIEAWNPIDVLIEQLADQVAQLDDVGAYIELYERSLAGEPAQDGLPQGPPLEYEEDPRHLFREYERERARPYAEPARVISMGDSLGQVIESLRKEHALDAEKVAYASGIDASYIERLEQDSLDLQRELSVYDFGKLLHQLHVAPSEPFYRLVEDTLVRNDRHFAHQTLARGRKLTRIRTRPDQAPEDERRARARAWVDKLRQVLAERR